VYNFTFRKLLCFLLVLSLACLCACNSGGNDESTAESLVSEETDGSKGASEWVEELDNVNEKYSGQTFKVVSTSASLFLDSEKTPIAKAVSNRNLLVEQKMGITVDCVEKTAAEIEKELRAAISKNQKYADLICAPADVLANLAEEGLLENLYSLPYTDFSAGYINKAELESQTVNNTMYMLSGLLTMDIGGTVGVFYNKSMLSGAGADPVALVKNGTWTWDAFTNISKTVNGNGVYAVDSLLSDKELAAAVYGSCGGHIITAGTDKPATAAFDSALSNQTALILNNLLNNSTYTPDYDNKEAAEAFNNGKTAFIIARLDNVSLFNSTKNEWGLAPLPKLSADQSGYCSPVMSGALAVAVPRCGDSAFSGFTLNALLAASTDDLQTALMQTYVNYHFWSNSAASMLNLIAETKRIDLGIMYSSLKAVADIGMDLLANQSTAMSAENAAAFNALADKLFN